MGAEKGTAGDAGTSAWWERRALLVLLPLLMSLPLLFPPLPPLTDVPGHMGRYKIALDLAHSPSLQAFYDFRWALVPNLGADLLVVLLARLLDLEVATKIVAMLIPVLTTLGFVWVSKEAHGRVTPAVLLAAPLSYNFAFLYGFLNFTLSAALAFLALGLWMRLGRLGQLHLRAALFVPIALLVWLCHAFGWGMLGLLAFGVELARELRSRGSLWRSAMRAGLRVLPLAVPIVPMLVWQGQTPAGASDWFNLPWKLLAVVWVLRDRWLIFDLASLVFLLAVLILSVRDKRIEAVRDLAIPALILFAAFLILPRLLLGASHNDNRLLPYALAAALLALRPSAAASRQFINGFALVALVFFALRIAGVGASAWIYGRAFQAEAAAIERLPRAARVASFVNISCPLVWTRSRLDQLPNLAIVRREAFANAQWTVAGSHLLKVKPPYEDYVSPTHIVAEPGCGERLIGQSLAAVPPQLFDYVWLIQPSRYDPALTRGWEPVWRRGPSVLFKLPEATAERR